ncbi:hypothetical protein [uncultured Maribacter sp.]|uniref:hypothetical protein n=1 Tax=uncultured Maribacter sp. TaxID=431308 RepID=UPI0030D9E33D|tara:strand:- start:364 stop:2952 length:2589 start_codon:yes stop_codon:yes gene_type:complete
MAKSYIFTMLSFLTLSSLFAQDKLKETLERFENGNAKVVRYKSNSLKTMNVSFLNENGRTVASIPFDTLSGKLHGDFFDPYNKGNFKKGNLNCDDCLFSFDRNNNLYRITLIDGKVNGQAIKWKVNSNHYIGQFEQNEQYSEVPLYILTNVERYFSKKKGNQIELVQQAQLLFEDGFLKGNQVLEYNTYEYSRNLAFLPIVKTELLFSEGILKGFKTLDEQNNIVDSLYSTTKSWKYRNELVENKGEIFHIFHKNNHINLTNLTLITKNNYNYSPEKQTLKKTMTNRDGYFLQQNPFKDDYGNAEGVVYDNPVIFYPSNLNTNKQGILEIDFNFEHYLLNDFFAQLIKKLLTNPSVMFDPSFRFFPDIPEPKSKDILQKKYDYQGSYWERARISESYMDETLRPYKNLAPQTPSEFINLVQTLRDDHKIFLNSFYVKTSHKSIDTLFKELVSLKKKEANETTYTKFSIDDLVPYFEHLDEQFKRYNSNKKERLAPLQKTLSKLYESHLSLEDFNGNEKYRELNRSKRDFLSQTFSSDDLIAPKKNNSPDNYNFDAVYLLNEEDFLEWLGKYEKLIELSQNWIADVSEWDSKLELFKNLFFNLLTRYPITSSDRDKIVIKITSDSIYGFPSTSLFLDNLPHRAQYEGTNSDFQRVFHGNTANRFSLMRLYQPAFGSKDLIKLFEFSNYIRQYQEIKAFNTKHLPNYGGSAAYTIKNIKVLYQEAFVHNIKHSSNTPLNQVVYASIGFPCSNNTYTNKVKEVYTRLNLNFDRMVIYSSVNSDWGINANTFIKYPKKNSIDDNPSYFAHTFYKSESKFNKDIERLKEVGIDYILPLANYFDTLGDCEKNDKFFRYSIIITGNPSP